MSETRPQHHRAGGGFGNPWVSGRPAAFGGFLKWVLVHRTTRPRAADPDPRVFVRVAPQVLHPRAATDQLVSTWVGHSTFLVQVGGRNVLTDPMWSERASPVRFAGPQRWVAPGIGF